MIQVEYLLAETFSRRRGSEVPGPETQKGRRGKCARLHEISQARLEIHRFVFWRGQVAGVTVEAKAGHLGGVRLKSAAAKTREGSELSPSSPSRNRGTARTSRSCKVCQSADRCCARHISAKTSQELASR